MVSFVIFYQVDILIFFTVVLCFSREFSLIRPSYFSYFLYNIYGLQCHVSTHGDLKYHDHY
uniref:Uncharacterized protein n=1 Tax=Solanum lycopersicum TaxID=4081 RepID=A0A3Q7J6H8_SOLLC